MVAVLSKYVVADSGDSETAVSNSNNLHSAAPLHRLLSDICVAIVASERDDATRVARLLRQSGLQRECLFFYDSQPVQAGDAFAVVVCHRQSDDALRIETDRQGHAPRVIVLSECNREKSVVEHLHNGARHVFAMDESDTVLQVRLEAALRQHSTASLKSFTVGDIRFDMQKRQVLRAGRVVDLSPKEFALARYLFSNTSRIVSNSELMTFVWSLPSFMDTRRIDTAACRVRKKLYLIPSHGWELKKIRRVGYRLNRISRNMES